MTKVANALPLSITRLRDDEGLKRDLGLTWLSSAEAEATRQDWLAAWNRVPYGKAFHARCHARLARTVPLAKGPVRTRRGRGDESQLVLIHDPEESDVVFISLSHAMPAMLWIRCGASGPALRRALSPYLVEQTPAARDLPQVARIVETPGIDDHNAIERSVQTLDLWLEDATTETPGPFPTLSWRSLWSRGLLRLERHPMGMWVFEMRYAPAHDGEVIDSINLMLSCKLPRDLPLDLAASLLRGQCLGEHHLKQLEARKERPQLQAALICALSPGPASSHDALKRLAEEHGDDGEVISTITNLATVYRHDDLLFELASMVEDSLLEPDMRKCGPPTSRGPSSSKPKLAS